MTPAADADDSDLLTLDADDSDLLTLVRDGDPRAMAELWSRHYPATLTAARRVSRQPKDAEEFASDAFSGMLQAISNDAGPSTSVRGYLLASVRNQAANRARRASSNDVLTGEIGDFEDTERASLDPVAHHAELGLVREAFATLPPRWQMVLWRTAVDHEKNTDLAAELGRSPNAVAALAKRARTGFRTAYIRAHGSTHGIAPECAPYVPRLVELLPEADAVTAQAVRDHVADCPMCARRLADLRIVDADLGAALLPALLTLGPGIAWLTAGHIAAPVAGSLGGAAWLPWGRAAGQSRKAVIGGVATVVAVAGACSAFALTRTSSDPSPNAAAHSVTQSDRSPSAARAAASDSARASVGSAAAGTSTSTSARSTTSTSSVSSSTSSSTAPSTSRDDTSPADLPTQQPPSRQRTSSSVSIPSSTRSATSTKPPVRRTWTTTPPARGTSTSTTKPLPAPPSPPLPSPTDSGSPTTKPKPRPTSTPTTPPPKCLPLVCWPWNWLFS